MESADAVTDGPEVKVGTSEDKQLELLLILEEGDELFDVTNSREKGRTVLRVKKSAEEAQDDASGSAGSSRKQSHEKMEKDAVDVQANEEKSVILEHRPEGECEVSVKMEGLSDGKGETAETEKITHGETADLCGDAAAEVKLRPKDRLSPHDAKHTAHRLSPDWPDALCELLFALQEGRRLNDQRCSFQLEPRRRCYSEPGTPRHSQRVHFSSMTSLQKEEFFDLLVTSQGRRLDDQRAELQNVPSAPPAPAPVKAKPRRSSWKVTEVVRKIPTQKPQEDFYNMIVCTQAQGRLEEQRSAAPGPMDDEDFFSLLLKVQGGRMEEQRTEMKPVPQLL